MSDEQDDDHNDDGPDLYPESEELDLGDLKADTLMGDLRDAMLGQFRQQKRPWSMLVEDEQREVANAYELAAKNLVRKTVRLLSNFDFPCTAVTLGEVKIKGEKGIEAKITCGNVEHNRTVLGEHVGTMMTLYAVDSEVFMAERARPAISPDQGSLLRDDEAA